MNDTTGAGGFFITGRLKGGKGYVADIIGLPIVSFAAALKAVLGVTAENKDEKRPLLQKVGQMARGDIAMTPKVRAILDSGYEVTGLGTRELWSSPAHKNYWVDLALYDAPAEFVCDDARFANEVEALHDAGLIHIHVYATTACRMRRADRKYKKSVDEDTSEQMAIALDDFYLDKDEIRYEDSLPSEDVTCMTLRVWSDDKRTPSPLVTEWVTPEQIEVMINDE